MKYNDIGQAVYDDIFEGIEEASTVEEYKAVLGRALEGFTNRLENTKIHDAGKETQPDVLKDSYLLFRSAANLVEGFNNELLTFLAEFIAKHAQEGLCMFDSGLSKRTHLSGAISSIVCTLDCSINLYCFLDYQSTKMEENYPNETQILQGVLNLEKVARIEESIKKMGGE